MPSNDHRLLRSQAGTPDVAFVACIEGGVLEAQALVLFESIRLHTGRFRDCAAYALSPRPGHGISTNARRRLEALGVHYLDTVLNAECQEYGSANRVAAAAYVEDACDHEFLVILDSDTMFLREPNEILLPPDIDVAVRPVDLKGMCTEGREDPFDTYWQDLCRLCGVDWDQIPWAESFIDRRRIKACYNGGFVIARREAGIMRRTADFFFASVRERLTPRKEGHRFRAGAGWVKPAAAKLWGSSQAALSLAIWGGTRRLQELPPTYNYPLNMHDRIESTVARAVLPHLVHAHYHGLLAEGPSANPLLYEPGALDAAKGAWLRLAGKQVQSADRSLSFLTLWQRVVGSRANG